MVWLGLAKVGIVTALLNTAARGRVLKHALEQTGACAFIYGSECAERVASLAAAERPALLFEATQPQDARDPAARCLEAAMAQASEANPERSTARRCASAIRSTTSSPPARPGCRRRPS